MNRVVWQHIPVEECGEPLVDLSKFNFVLDPMYFKQGVGDSPACFLRERVAEKLQRVQKNLLGHRLKIWDPWRSREIQAELYTYYRNQLAAKHPAWDKARLDQEIAIFVAPPSPDIIPPHSTGGAVDLTLVEPNGDELDMGTGFDYFGPEAASLYFEEEGRDPQVRENRRLLREAMSAEDFRFDEFEWWHFDFGNQIWAAAKGHAFAPYSEVTALSKSIL
ncbi:M15 family metallopeptidase [Pseudanabaena sp. FACHB-2040]|uniref:M15 family metallopeptidase n=1 Tax=Pseudanabaena sp. FACHB-2040 TaxID=2692859 RepID=UPI0016838959|nr:M15 family metallopeptidase [Pseudanabaena sp. FACHB-2040]MBD2257179.1 D-alanyl-D-alanine dipeptidase [Pseudanabaena sp. FACHB-2040]